MFAVFCQVVEPEIVLAVATWKIGPPYESSSTLALTVNARRDSGAAEVVLAFQGEADIATWIASIDWCLFARDLFALTDLRRIAVDVKKRSRQRVAYMEHAHQHLELLSLARGISLEFVQRG